MGSANTQPAHLCFSWVDLSPINTYPPARTSAISRISVSSSACSALGFLNKFFIFLVWCFPLVELVVLVFFFFLRFLGWAVDGSKAKVVFVWVVDRSKVNFVFVEGRLLLWWLRGFLWWWQWWWEFPMEAISLMFWLLICCLFLIICVSVMQAETMSWQLSFVKVSVYCRQKFVLVFLQIMKFSIYS